jgi:hypothetical protein
MAVTHNWNDVRQGVINTISTHIKDFKKNALEDIRIKLNDKGIPKVDVKSSSVEFVAISKTEYDLGKVYFDEVFKDINSQSWIDNI